MTEQEAVSEIQRRGWGVIENRGGMIMVGPLVDGMIEVYAAAKDMATAVEKAMEHERKEGTPHQTGGSVDPV